MAVDEKCSVCQVDSSPVWRRDKVTRERVCNRCYLKPRAQSLGDFAAESLLNDSADFALSLAGGKEPKADGADERGRRKRKHRGRDEAAGSASDPPAPPADMDLSTPAAETDSEYADISLDETPKAVVVKASGHQKIDGTYQRLTKASRGKPCYAKWMEKKPMYLFWNKKWIIGWDFGSSKSYANVKDMGKSSPCEPYPKAWKVLDKHDKKDKHGKGADGEAKESRKYVDTLAMRVIDSACLEFDAPDDLIDAPDESAAKARHHSRRESSRTKSHKPTEGKEKAASEDKTPTSTEAAAEADKDALGPGSSSEEEKQPSEASAEESDSSSEESSSSTSASPKKKDQGAAPLEARRVQESPEQKAADFEAKMREKLSLVPPGELRQKQFLVVKEHLLKRANGIDGMAQGQLQAVLSKLQRWIRETLPAEPAAPAAAQLGPAPPAPRPERVAAPVRSALRKPGTPRQRARRIGFTDIVNQKALVNKVQVESFRGMGETLWYQMPGAVVVCDMCEKEVLQSMGSLQGAPSQSQFAQSKFLCSDCSGM